MHVTFCFQKLQVKKGSRTREELKKEDENLSALNAIVPTDETIVKEVKTTLALTRVPKLFKIVW